MHNFVKIKEKAHTKEAKVTLEKDWPMPTKITWKPSSFSEVRVIPFCPSPLSRTTCRGKKMHLSQSVCIIHIKRMLASIILRCCEFQDIITWIILQPLWQQYTDQYSYDTLVQTEWFYGHMGRYVLGYKWQIDPMVHKLSVSGLFLKGHRLQRKRMVKTKT